VNIKNNTMNEEKMEKVILITGATGFVGQNLVHKIIKTERNTNLVLLVRGTTDEEAITRMEIILMTVFKDIEIDKLRKRIEIVKGDVSKQNLGLTAIQYQKLTNNVTHIIHSAAMTKFDLTLAEARAINCTGTKNVMEFARQALRFGKLSKVAHISTAYVSGNRPGVIYEGELDFNQRFSNTYEQSKFESEQMIRKFFKDIPVIIFRPSIIVGHSKTGETTSFNVLYYPLKLLYRGYLKIIPGWKDVLMDVVPIDFVCDSIYHILLKTSITGGKTYHLTAGMDKALTLKELTSLATYFFNRSSKQREITNAIFLPPIIVSSLVKTLLFFATKIRQIVEIYGPYMAVKRAFDNRDAMKILTQANITPPALTSYLENILGYCINTDWGKRVNTVV
jgi:thioester reductase-like protein